jgi:transposase
MEAAGGAGARQRVLRIHRTIAEKRRIVEQTFEPGVSVAAIAQASGVNTNQVFKWRRAYERGELIDVHGSARTLLPVVIADGVAVAGDQQQARLSESESPTTQSASTGLIHIELSGLATIRIESGADRALLRTILELLRK